jgi:hypothetical protein
MGPPALPPNWFNRNGCLEVSNGFRASILSFRTNSKMLLWNSFVPDFDTKLTCAPAPPPDSAE